MFGEIASFRSYEVPNRLTSELVNFIFGIPLLDLSGDFGPTNPHELTKMALKVFSPILQRWALNWRHLFLNVEVTSLSWAWYFTSRERPEIHNS